MLTSRLWRLLQLEIMGATTQQILYETKENFDENVSTFKVNLRKILHIVDSQSGLYEPPRCISVKKIRGARDVNGGLRELTPFRQIIINI